MRQDSTGCIQSCPMCRRKCDELHKENEDVQVHKCNTGH
jgi:hypothetical protein